MPRTSALMTTCVCAGMLAALCSSLIAWKAGQMGVPAMLDVRMAPKLTSAWIYSRVVWGGIWGLTYFLAVGPLRARRHWARKGMWISLLPTLFQLLVIYPKMTGHDWLGLSLGQFTPLFVFVYNLIWGLFTGIFCRLLWGRG
jgi:hypothetical protein